MPKTTAFDKALTLEDTNRTKPTIREALLTCALVLYPAFATVATVAAGLFFSGMTV